MATVTQKIGPITAYAIAKEEGYTGTKAEFAQEIGNASVNAQAAANSATAAEGYGASAATSASNAMSTTPTGYNTMLGSLVAEYDPTKTYSAGDYCRYNSEVYLCLVNITTAEGFNSSHWSKTKLADAVSYRSDVDTGIYNNAVRNAIQKVNLFDKNSTLNTSGQYWSTGGVLTTGADSKYVTSHPILVGPGTYKFNATTNNLGNNAAAVAVLDYNGNLIRMNNGTVVDDSTAVSVTFPETCIIQFNFINTRANRLVFSKLSDFPASVGYYSGTPQNTSVTTEANSALEKSFEVYTASKNLFNKNSTQIVSGEYWEISGVNRTEQSATLCKSHPITVPAGTYKFSSSSTFGTNAAAVAVLDSTGAMIRIIAATIANNVATFSVDRVSRVQFNLTSENAASIVFCSSALWDGTYHPYSAEIDNALLNLTGFVTKEDTTFFNHAVSENLLDISDPIADKYFEVSSSQTATLGELKTYSTANAVSSFYVKIDGAGTYTTKADKNLYGSTNAARLALYDANKNYIEIVTGTLGDDSDNYSVTLSFDITDSHAANGVTYVGLTVANAYINTTMFVKSSTYPAEYEPYESHWEIPDLIIDKDQVPEVNRSAVDLTNSITKEDTTFFSHYRSANLLDLSNPIIGKYFNVSNGTLVDYSARVMYSFYVALDGAGDYVTKVTKFLYGTNAAKITLFDSNKNYLSSVTGTLGDDSDPYSVQNNFTITSTHIANGAAYAGLTVESNYVYSVMFVKSSTYPSVYVPYADNWTIPTLSVNDGQAPTYESNPLYGKEAVFDGDSICASGTDTSNNGSYAGRLAARNAMSVQNYAVGGGTLTSGLYFDGGSARHWVSANVDTMYADHPNADYIMFEGGTNDADLIGSIISGSTPANFGTFDPMDFSGSYDDETFCGAVETIIFKAMSHWPKKKIGFIIAPKMGYTGTSYQNRRAYFGKIMEICDKWGLPYLNLWNECPINPRLLSCYDNSMTAEQNAEAGKMYLDGQHPTPTGYDRITPIIEAWMKTL